MGHSIAFFEDLARCGGSNFGGNQITWIFHQCVGRVLRIRIMRLMWIYWSDRLDVEFVPSCASLVGDPPYASNSTSNRSGQSDICHQSHFWCITSCISSFILFFLFNASPRSAWWCIDSCVVSIPVSIWGFCIAFIYGSLPASCHPLIVIRSIHHCVRIITVCGVFSFLSLHHNATRCDVVLVVLYHSSISMGIHIAFIYEFV